MILKHELLFKLLFLANIQSHQSEKYPNESSFNSFLNAFRFHDHPCHEMIKMAFR